jgi:mannose/fructose/N-acetylgalactosamine-specific phosphotransferase system component IIC
MENSEETRSGVPRGLPIAAVILLILGFIAMPVINNNATDEQLAKNVILSAIPFILIFASIILAFMTVVWYVSSRLNDNISEKSYRPVEILLIGGILLGVVFIFQPWVFELFRVGFFLLLASTIGFILWSHVRPKPADLDLAQPVEGESGSGSGE